MTERTWLFEDLSNPLALDAGSHSDGWYTPAWLVEKARAVLGGIDTDPASCEAAQSVVQATTYYTRNDDGLARSWHGRLWLNPPYSRTEPWTRKAMAAYASGAVPAALILTNAYTDTNWWQDLAQVSVMLFSRNRWEFWHPDKTPQRNRMGQTLAYLGSEPTRFRATFGHLGIIR